MQEKAQHTLIAWLKKKDTSKTKQHFLYYDKKLSTIAEYPWHLKVKDTD